MRSLQPDESRAVLIGVADYPEQGTFHAVEAALHNVSRLKLLLSSPEYAGFLRATEYTRPVVNPQTGEGIRAAVQRAIGQATDVLLVYYVGHGARVGAERELYLTSCTTTTKDSVVTTGLRYNVLRDMLRAARARVVILILDCCFSGIAASVLGDEPLAEEDLIDRPALAGDVEAGEVEGLCVIASSGPADPSGASDGADFTAFTGNFVAILEERRDNDDEPLLLGELFSRTEKRMDRLGLDHRPLMASVGTAGNLTMRQARAAGDAPKAAAAPVLLDEDDAEGSAQRIKELRDRLDWRTTPGQGAATFQQTALQMIEMLLPHVIGPEGGDDAQRT